MCYLFVIFTYVDNFYVNIIEFLCILVYVRFGLIKKCYLGIILDKFSFLFNTSYETINYLCYDFHTFY